MDLKAPFPPHVTEEYIRILVLLLLVLLRIISNSSNVLSCLRKKTKKKHLKRAYQDWVAHYLSPSGLWRGEPFFLLHVEYNGALSSSIPICSKLFTPCEEVQIYFKFFLQP